MALDRLVTNYSDPSSFTVTGKLNHGNAFVFDLRAWGQKFAYYYQEWELDFVDVLSRLYPGGTFVDVGSSLGLYSVSLGYTVRAQNGKILSFEPLPLNVERQRVNIELNGLGDVIELFPIALGKQDGTAPMYSDPERADNNAFFCPTGDVEVPIRAFDDVLAELSPSLRPITTVKIDVEGFEPDVLVGARRMFDSDTPILFAEFNRERMKINNFSIEPSWRFLEEHGYKPFQLRAGKLRRLDHLGELQNLFFLPPWCAVPEDLAA